MASRRIEYLDAVKGFAIFLVVFAHAIGWNVSDVDSIINPDYHQPFHTAWKGLLWQIVYSFHMPLFFMISGYFLSSIDAGMTLSEKTSKLKKQVVRKSVRLLIPYFFTGFLVLLYKGYYGYWFLFSLWEVSLLSLGMSYIISYVNHKGSIWIDLAGWAVFYLVLKIILPRLPHTDWVEFDRCLFSLPAFICGILMRKYSLLERLHKRNVIICLCGFIFAFVLAYLPYAFPESVLVHKGSVGLRTYIIPLLGCVAVIGSFKLMSPDSVEYNVESKMLIFNMLKYLGVFSLEIYILHLFLVVKIPQAGDWINSLHPSLMIPLQLLFATAVAAVAIALSVLCAKAIHKIPLLPRLLFGSPQSGRSKES